MKQETFGPIRVFKDVSLVKQILINEGFEDPSPLQNWKEEQVFGLVKKINQTLEMHVRGYADNSLDSEIELSREYLEHPYDCRPYYSPLLNILKHYGISYRLTRELPPDPISVRVPKNKTPWKPIVAGIGITATFGILLWALLRDKKDEDEERR